MLRISPAMVAGVTDKLWFGCRHRDHDRRGEIKLMQHHLSG